MDVLEVPQGSYRLERWRAAPRSPLRAWDAADEYLLNHLADTEVGGASWVVHNDAFGALVCALADRSPVSVGDSWTGFAAARRNAEANGLTLTADRQRSPLEAGDDAVDVALLKVPKSLALLEDQLRRLRPRLHAGSAVVGAGMARHIHTSTLELFERVLGPTSTSLARKKARLIHAEVDLGLDVGPNPYPTRFLLPTGETVVNHANVFSRDRLDVGTRLLLDHLPDAKGRVVDVGCGSGIIALRMAAANPEVSLVLRDDSFHAVASAAATLTEAGVDADVEAGDGLDGIDDGSVDVVVSNPPFHDDHAVGDEVAWSIFTGARRVLRPGGELRIVGNRHLDYHVKLKRIFGNVETVGSNPKFVVLSARR